VVAVAPTAEYVKPSLDWTARNARIASVEGLRNDSMSSPLVHHLPILRSNGRVTIYHSQPFSGPKRLTGDLN
jgi:hypothetical protein